MGEVAAYATSCVRDRPEDRLPPPQILSKAFLADRWGLPESGGRLDQPAGLLAKMHYALTIYEVWSGYLRAEARGNNVAYITADPQRRRFLYEIMRAEREQREHRG